MENSNVKERLQSFRRYKFEWTYEWYWV